jgi:MFS family permease
MGQIFRSVSSLMLAVALLMLGTGVLSTLVSVQLADAGTPSIAIGAIMAAYYAGLTAGSLFAYRIIARVGHIRTFAALAAGLSAAALSHVLSFDPVLWAVLRLIEGYCMAGLFICIESWLNHRATTETRGQLLSLYMITLYGAMAAGQQFLNIDDPSGMVRFTVTSLLLSVALIPVALTNMTPPVLPDIRSFGFRRLYEASPLGVVGTFISGLVTGAVYGMAPVYGTQSGFGVSGTALFMTVIILGGVVLQWPLGKLSDLFDRRLVLIGLSAALAAASAAMSAVAALPEQWALLAVSLLFGGLVFTLYPVCIAHTNDHIDSADLVSASGGLILAYSVGATIGPLAASGTMSAAGPAGLFAFIGACALAAALLGLWRTRVRPPVPAADQGPFLALPSTTPVVAPLDPRGEEMPDNPIPDSSMRDEDRQQG